MRHISKTFTSIKYLSLIEPRLLKSLFKPQELSTSDWANYFKPREPVIEMTDAYVQPAPFGDFSAKLRDMEEKQRLLKDRVLLIGQSLVEQREKSFAEIQEMKRTLMLIKDESDRIKELLERVTEQLNSVARKEELAAIQRQIDLMRK